MDTLQIFDEMLISIFVAVDVTWIGLQDFDNEGTFVWSDSSPLAGYTNWLNNQPDNGATSGGVGQVS